ncbi:MAG TPA: DoxX family protein [Actinocatenispora sp.]
MDIALWIMQAVLAVTFLVSGTAKSTLSRERLVALGQTGVAVFPHPVVRVTAAAELLGVLGIILPWATGVAPALTPLAAVGFAGVMVGAIVAHVRLREPRNVVLTSLLFVLAVTVAVGRFAQL